MQLVANRLSRQYPDTDAGAAIGLLPQKETLLNPIARPGDYQKQRIGVALFLALPILVLLLACFNVANILLVRATAREHEMAVRAALGAGRGRLVRQLLTESLLLAFLGCGAGLFLGSLGAGFFESIRVSIGVPLNLDFSFDWRVFASAAAAAVLAGLVVGLMPAVRASRIGPGGALGEGRTVVRGGHRLRNILVTAEVAGSIVLLIVAGLFTRSLGKVQRMDLGFNPAHLVNLTMDPHDAGYSAAQAQQFYKDLLVRVRALPGVRSASVAFTYPSSTAAFSSPVLVEGRPLRPGEAAPTVLTNRVSPGYFETLETPILSGRAFRDSDTATAPRVAVVNQTMARQLWPNQEALGKRFHMNSAAEPWIEVTGIAADSKYVSVLAKSVPYFYVPLAQYDVSFGTLLVRTETAPGSMTGSVEEQVRMLAPGLPVIDVRTMEQALNSGLTGFYAFHLGADLAAALGILGLALAIVGVYGVISYSTSQRTHEIGLRMALGASQGDIWRVISPQGVAIVVAGIAIGILAAFAVTRVMAGFLYGVSAQDPLTYAGVCTLVAAVALLACYLPARRATKLDPMVALRYE